MVKIMSKNERLEKQGWKKMTTIDEPRLSEIAAEYKEIGLEVHLEPVVEGELDEECRKCYEGSIDELKTVWTRKKK